jgi:hypothetical protein
VIHIVTALPAEARPLIDHFRLHGKSTSGGFRIHEGNGMAVVTSGPGKVAAAAATALLAGRLEPGSQAAWLNIGIAGHADLEIGQGRLAHRITDRASGQKWYPPRVFDLPLASTGLLTVDTPENEYPEAVAYDMEASGFYPVAGRFSTTELVQCYKVISDNRTQGTGSVTAKQCTRLIAEKLDDIASLVHTLEDLQQQHHDRHRVHDGIRELTRLWHFTVSQQHQLADLARRWRALMPDQPLWLDSLKTHDSAAHVLNSLQQHLNSQPVRLGAETGADRV